MPPLVAASAAAGSFALYLVMFVVLSGEPWDATAYGPVVAIATAAAAFARPRASVWIAIATLGGQLGGWAACAALFETRSLSYWPLVAFFTLPLFVAPLAAGGALVGGAAGWWHLHRRARGPRDPRPGR